MKYCLRPAIVIAVALILSATGCKRSPNTDTPSTGRSLEKRLKADELPKPQDPPPTKN